MERILDLGMHPFADSFVPADRTSENEPVYPLICDMCAGCGHVQTECVTDPLQRYTLYDYSYTSSNSSFSRNHWQEYAKSVASFVDLKQGGRVIEVGSNDGFLSQQFLLNNKAQVLGVDPVGSVSKMAKERGVPTLQVLFGTSVLKQVRAQFGSANLIVANNVLNHANDPNDFVSAVSQLLTPDGWFVFEVPYWRSSVETGHFDQIYHEHVSYFSVRPLRALLKRAGLVMARVEVVDYHGGSLRVFACASGLRSEAPEAEGLEREETAQGLYDCKWYARWQRLMLQQRSQFLAELMGLKASGASIVAIGAAAKGNTLLCYYGLNHFVVDFVTDASPVKQGKYTPLTRIPIAGDEVLAKHDQVYAIILSWNITNLLKEKLATVNPRIKYINLPEGKVSS